MEFCDNINEPLSNTSSKNEKVHTFSEVTVKKEPIERVTKIIYGYMSLHYYNISYSNFFLNIEKESVEFRPKTNEPLPNTSSKNEIIHTFSGVAVKKEPIERVTKIFYGYMYNIENY